MRAGRLIAGRDWAALRHVEEWFRPLKVASSRRNCRHGPLQTQLIGSAGIGAVGAELAPLVVGSLLLFEVADAPPRDLVETALAGYLVGLREVGWGGDEGLVRLGFLATAALLYTVCSAGFMVALLGDPARYPAFEQSLGRPMAEAVASWVELRPFQVELVEEARRLLSIKL